MLPALAGSTCTTAQSRGTLLCGDLFTQLGDGPAVQPRRLISDQSQAAVITAVGVAAGVVIGLS